MEYNVKSIPCAAVGCGRPNKGESGYISGRLSESIVVLPGPESSQFITGGFEDRLSVLKGGLEGIPLVLHG